MSGRENGKEPFFVTGLEILGMLMCSIGGLIVIAGTSEDGALILASGFGVIFLGICGIWMARVLRLLIRISENQMGQREKEARTEVQNRQTRRMRDEDYEKLIGGKR